MKMMERITIFLICFILIGSIFVKKIGSDELKSDFAELNEKKVQINPMDDTFLREQAPDIPHGDWENLRVRNQYGAVSSDWGEDILVKFNLSIFPLETNITSARLKMYYYLGEYDPEGRELNIYRVTENWQEDTATWNNHPSIVISPTTFSIVPSTNGWMEWDVTDDVQDIVDGVVENFGWKITDDNYWGSNDIPKTMFRSKEFGSFVPYLEVEFAPPNANFTYNPINPTRIDIIQFYDTSTDDGTITDWFWEFGDEYSSTLQNPTHQYADLGTYLVNLTVWDNENNSNTTQKIITIVNSFPLTNFTYFPTNPDVEETVSFYDASFDLDGNISSWQWFFGDGYSSTLQNPIHNYQNNGLYEVELTVTDNEGDSTTVRKIVPVDTSLYSFVNLSNGWNLVSIPYNSSVLKDELFIHHNDSLYSWSAACSYLNPTNSPILNEYVFGWNRVGGYYQFENDINSGYGYWLYAYQDCQLLVEELPLNPDTYITTLQVGWNLMGNPHLQDHDITLLLFDYQGTYYNWTKATTNNNPTNNPIINPYLFGWHPNQYYEFITEFVPGKSYWIYAFTQCDMHSSTWLK